MMEHLALAVVGGLLAGVVALAVGGVGDQWRVRRALRLLADQLGDTEAKLEREVKRRNATSEAPRARGATPADVLAELRSAAAPVVNAPPSRDDIVRAHDLARR